MGNVISCGLSINHNFRLLFIFLEIIHAKCGTLGHFNVTFQILLGLFREKEERKTKAMVMLKPQLITSSTNYTSTLPSGHY